MIKPGKYTNFLHLCLVVVFIYTSFGYVLLFHPAKILIKWITQHSVEQTEENSDHLTILTFSLAQINSKTINFKWVEEDEFEFNGNMYDVKKKSVSGDTLTLICYLDQKENLLNSLLYSLIHNNKKEAANSNANFTLLLGLYFEELPDKIFENLKKQNSDLFIIRTERGIKNYIKDIPTPPPRLIS